MANLKNTKRGVFYWKGETPFISVTEILKIIDKPALRYWFGQEVYYAMLKDPTLQKEAALSAPYKTSGDAKSRGSTVHSIVEAYKHTKEHIETVPEQFRGYANAFYKFVEEYKPEILEHERSIFSETHQFAGTLDMLMKIDGNLPIVVDVKTGKDIYAEAFLQTSAYHEALIEEGYKVDGIAVLLLQEDGTYKFEHRTEVKSKFKGFLAAKELYMSINEEMLKKVGYINAQKGLGI